MASHEGTEKPKTLEAKIVHDADVIEKLGLLGIIRHTWKLTNSNKINPEQVTDENVATVLEHIKWRKMQLQTPLARKIGTHLQKAVSKKTAETVVRVAAPLAFKGVITEKIAVALRKSLSAEENNKLKEQLNLGYLKKIKA